MKKLIIFALFLTIISCSNKSDDVEPLKLFKQANGIYTESLAKFTQHEVQLKGFLKAKKILKLIDNEYSESNVALNPVFGVFKRRVDEGIENSRYWIDRKNEPIQQSKTKKTSTDLAM